MRLIGKWRKDAESIPSLRYVDVCDGIRVLSIGIVAWFHIWQQSWLWPGFDLFGHKINFDPIVRSGYIWVDLMILLSGFCNYLPWARLEDGQPMPGVKRFYIRRIARILPSYFLAVLICFLGACLAGFYYSYAQAGKDLITHFTFTSVFFYDTYYGTPINAGLWTIVIEIHFYILFPVFAMLFRKNKLLTASGMIVLALAFRHWTATHLQDVSLYFNQLIAYLDIFAIGMLTAHFHVVFSRFRHGMIQRMLFSAVSLISFCVLLRIGRAQSRCPDIEAIRLGQMQRRLWMGIAGGLFLFFSAHSGLLIRRILGNPVARFLAGISMQFYIWHQVLAVQILYLRIIPSFYENPNYMGDRSWQVKYTLLCVAAAFFVSVVLTYFYERPIAERLAKHFHL